MMPWMRRTLQHSCFTASKPACQEENHSEQLSTQNGGEIAQDCLCIFEFDKTIVVAQDPELPNQNAGEIAQD